MTNPAASGKPNPRLQRLQGGKSLCSGFERGGKNQTATSTATGSWKEVRKRPEKNNIPGSLARPGIRKCPSFIRLSADVSIACWNA